jgi:hypothetical protein
MDFPIKGVGASCGRTLPSPEACAAAPRKRQPMPERTVRRALQANLILTIFHALAARR